MNKVIQTILTVKAATPELERSIARDITVEDNENSLTDDALMRMSMDYNKDGDGPKHKVVQEMGNSGQDFTMDDTEKKK
jgi:hypothetical protein